MLKHFTYIKKNGKVSERVVYTLRLVDDKLLAIDMTEYNDAERNQSINVLDMIHREYLDNIYAAGFSDDFRSFFLENMS